MGLTTQQIESIVARVPGGARNIQDIYPLAPLQEGILFHHLLTTQGDPYVSWVMSRFDSRERMEKYVSAMQEVINRHDILRTSVVWEGLPEATQVVWRNAPLHAEEVVLDPADGETVHQLAARFNPRHYRLDVRVAPMMHVAFAQEHAGGSYVLVHLFHHLVLDHTALEIVHHEIAAYLRGEEGQLPEPVPFRTVVAQARLGVSREEHEAFFRAMLGDVSEPTLPFGLADVQGDGSDVAAVYYPIDTSLSQRLRECARRLGVSAASVCHVAWARVLSVLSGRDDVVFGTVLFGRMQGGAGSDRGMGLFLNTLPVRVKMATSVEVGVRQTHAALAQLMYHEHAPLALAQRCSNVAAPTPLFSALLNYRHTSSGSASRKLDGIDVLASQERTNYPVTLSVNDFGEELSLSAQVVESLDARRMCGYMNCALEELVEALQRAPKSSLNELRVLRETERHQVLVEWNATERPYRSDACIHELFEEHVARTPDAIAVVYEDVQVSYGELNARANRLAHYLRSLGIGPEGRVALCLERSVSLVVAQLAVLKAGAAYVPLDEHAPLERLMYLVADSQAAVVLHDGIRELAWSGVPACIDIDSLMLDDYPSDNIGASAGSDGVAYIMYTSGSTGEPKGVVVLHRSVNRLVINNGYADFRASDRIAFAANPAFDASTLEVWAPLLTGGCIVVIARDVVLSPARFRDVLLNQHVSVLWLTVGLLRQYAPFLSDVFAALRYLIVGGDVVDAQTVAEILRRGAPEHVLNGYGPTETTTFAATFEIRAVPQGDTIPIGRPIGNTRIYILDERMEPMPIGVVGELYIGGAGVARGYWNRPDLTAERFVDSPFVAGDRLYKTGDVGRFLSDGTIEYLGRNDFQVKIRGFRIELGEIESTLRKYVGIDDVAVVAREDDRGEKRLVAYYVAAADARIDAEQLRLHVARTLPEYMVPAAYVCLESMPLTVNGKVDRRALPVPDEKAYSRSVYEAPQGEVEQTLARIWSEMLKVERVGRHDNFFALGGHSLLVVRLIDRMRLAGLHADVRTLFTASTLMELAGAVGREALTIVLPPNGIVAGSETITPAMLPLVTLNAEQVESIVAWVPGGARNIQDIYPLAPLQEGLLFHHLLATEGDPYVLYAVSRFDSRERVERYVSALQGVIDRHDILRTSVVWEGLPEAVQVVWRKAPLHAEEVVLDPADGEIVHQLAARFNPRHYRLDVRVAPMMHVAFAQEHAGGSWVLVHLFHHLVLDHTALEIVQHEIAAYLHGEEGRLPEPVPFRTVVAQARLGVSRDEHEAFFRAMLEDVSEPTLPFGLADVQGDGSDIAAAYHPLESSLSRRLRTCARRLGVSAASVCHVAWARVLSVLSGRDDVVFGTVLFGRMQGGAGSDRGMGLFLNTLPVRVKMATSVEVGVRQTHAALAQLMYHEHAPLALAQRCSGVAAPAPLFSALLNYRHFASEAVSRVLDGIQPLGGEERTNYPVTLSVNDFGEDLSLSAQVDGSLDAQRICGYMNRALEELVEALERAPKSSLNELGILPDAERRRMLVEWNATATAYPSDRCIHELFEEQVGRTPDAISLVYDDVQVSYDELNARANRLAHYLRSLGVGPESRVALCFERSIEMMVGLLGVLKAGGAYVPLDPSNPPDRLAYMLDDSAPSVTLTHGMVTTHVRAVLDHGGPPVIEMDQSERWSNSSPANPPRGDLRPTDLAYMIYTSGSTGQPKGVMIEHRQLMNYVSWASSTYLSSGGAVVSTSLSFDATVTSLFTPLVQGTKVKLLPEGAELEALEAHVIESRESDLIKITPAHLQVLAERLRTIGVAAPAKTFVVGGEALAGATVKALQSIHSGSTITNEYGPTEATVGSSTYLVREGFEGRHVPIGRPIANARIYILDERREPVPVGVTGELYIGGAGVARGYWNRADLTSERFLLSPFVAGDRLYKTGDVGRHLSDGTIEFLGRNDFQVKIRGFRIELGEIEARLVEYDGICESLVVAREDGNGEKRLVAYYVAAPDTDAINIERLRSHLGRTLPEYMVPAAYVAMESMPLTANGKIDRRALPAPDDMAYGRGEYEAPQGEVERLLAQIWSEALAVERVGRYDNFFALGGHSLLIVRVIDRMRSAGLHADVRTLFMASTLVELAGAVGREALTVVVPPNGIVAGSETITPDMLPLVALNAGQIESIAARVPGRARNIQDIYPLAPLQEGILFHHVLATEGDPYVSRIVSRFDSRERVEKYVSALQEVIARHDILRTSVVWEGLPEAVQVVWRNAPLHAEEVSLNPADGEIAQQLAARFSPRHYRVDVRTAPMMHIAFAQDPSDGSYVIAHLFHHLVLDHTTLEIVQHEIAAYLRGEEEHLPEPVPFRTVVAQARLGVSREEHEAFFRAMLGDVSESTLPFGLADVQGDGSDIDSAYFPIDSSLSRRIRTCARRLGVSAASVCHVAWARVLSVIAGNDDVVFGTVLFGRMQGGAAADRGMGLFMNTLPVRVKMSTPAELGVRETHAVLAQLMYHEHAPLALAQRCSGVPAPAPLFSALLNYRHISSNAVGLVLDGIALLASEERTNYPVTLSVNDFGEELSLSAQVHQPADARRTCGYMNRALEELVEALERAPKSSLNELQILPEIERHQVVVKWNETDRPSRLEAGVHELFEDQVARTPDAVALMCEDVQVSYGELNARANRLAHYLRSVGVGPESRVALCFERSVDMVVALLAVLKAGGAYVPLDPTYPLDQLVYMLQDSAPSVTLTHEMVAANVRAALDCGSPPVIAVDQSELWSDGSAANPDRGDLTPADLAFMIYSSDSPRQSEGSIGRPNGNTRMYILDERLEPVPIGVAGELYVGGAGVARGYWNRPELTAARFVPSPFNPGDRLYKTGDVGRYSADGTIELLGRDERQVRIRGFQIDLGEVESALLRYEGVRDAVVAAREDSEGEELLVGYYVVADDAEAIDAELLRSHVQSALPEHMVPAAYVLLESLPHTANGKVDRKGLPAPDESAYGRTVYEAPQGDVEQTLAEIWSEALAVERVGRHDNFFALGGHSLLIVRVLDRMRAAGLHADVRTLFTSSTLVDLAVAVGREALTVDVPPNGIVAASETITPAMLPLATLNAEQIESIVARVPGGARNIQDIYPLAPLQEGLLFHHLLATDGDPYVLYSVSRFDSRERVERYISALQGVIDRHDILRTSVVWEDLTEAVQVVWRKALLHAEEVVLDPADGEIVHQLAARFNPRHYRLDVRVAPMMHVAFAQEHAGGSWVLVHLFHHLVLDHTALEIVQHEIAAYLHGEEGQLPEPVPFRTVVAQARLGVRREEHEAFFRAMLEDVSEPTLPFGLADVQGDGTDVVAAYYPLESSLSRRLRQCARRLGVSAASVCHVAWARVLSVLSGRDDVVFGTVVFGRMQGSKDTDRVVGLPLNMLPVRVKMATSVEVGVRQTHAALAQLMYHEHAPLALAQRCSGVAAPAPLFSAFLNYRHFASEAVSRVLDGIKMLVGEERTNYPVTLSVNDLGEELSLSAKVHRSLDARQTCRYMHRALEELVEALERAPKRSLNELRVLPEAERHQLLVEWNATETAYPSDRCIHELFEEQVALAPDAVAVSLGDAQLTYGALNAKSNQLAQYLRTVGVKPGERIALCFERSIAMVVGVLAVLKAGGAYVPLDPSYPPDRLRYMLADSAPVAVLTHDVVLGSLRDVLREGVAAVVDVEADAALWSAALGDDLGHSEVRPDDLAYVMYTSGSTGQPKGVLVEHRGVANRLRWMQLSFDLHSGEPVLQKAPFGFDASVWEMFWPLVCGGKLVLAHRDGHKDPAYLTRLIRSEQLTNIHFVPSMLQVFLEHEDVPACTSLRRVFCGGEQLHASLVRRLRERLPSVDLYNFYGPTEATVTATTFSCPQGDLADNVPIGRPMANVRAYVLDTLLEPVPVGVAGELHIGGVQVARGYLNRPELTAERFVPSPFVAGDRLYKTGDVVRYLPDGTIEYVNRNDFQVKIRGFRIELGEIESALCRYVGIRDAVVVARADGDGGKRLVAYYVVAGAAVPIDAEQLRLHLGRTLPEYMVPAAYVSLESMPLTVNGKVDRKALPVPDDMAYSRSVYEAPQGEVEQTLARIWSELLKVERVGRHDNFFELGGHSLLAVRVLSRVRAELQAELSLSALFAHPVLKDCAVLLAGKPGSVLPAITAVDRTGPLPLSYAQQRMWFLSQLDGVSEAYHLPQSLRIDGELDRVALRRALDRLIVRHESLRTTFAKVDGTPVQCIGDAQSSRFALVEHDLRGHASAFEELHVLSAQESQSAFDLQAGPLIRGRLIQIERDVHVLLLTMHHIVSDGWSMGVFVREVNALYESYRVGGDDPLAPPPVQYADYAVWQRSLLSGEVLAEQSAYWKEQLLGAPPMLELRTDHVRPLQQNHTGDRVLVELDAQLTAQLKSLSRRHGTTLFMTLLAGWGALLSRLSGQDDVVIGTPVANRRRAELEDLIGFFVNTLAVRLDYSGRPTVSQVLDRVKRRSLQAQEHQDMPFEQVVELVNPPRSLSHSPVFQVTFAWQNNEQSALDLGGLQVTRLGVGYPVAKFDLTLELTESDGCIRGSLQYATSLFERETVQRYVAYLSRLFAEMVVADDEDITRIAVMSPAERHQVLVEWNATEAAYPSDRCIHELFEEQVARTPDAVGLVYEDVEVSYGELNARANRLAHYLRSLGVAPGARVVLCVERSVAMVVGVLAVLKAGGAYVPLDPSYPLDRLRYMLADSAPVAALTHDVALGSVQEVLREGVAAVVDIEADAARWSAAVADDLGQGEVRPDDLAYVIYTSGSTGEPKGVLVEHRGVANRLHWMQSSFDLRPGEPVLQKAAFSFDASVWEMFWPLVCGGKLVLAHPEGQKDPAYLTRLIRSEQFANIHFVPSMLQVFLEDENVPGCTSLRRVFCGGEQLHASLIRRLRERLPSVDVYNFYGPTEATVTAMTFACPQGDLPENVPIGRPMANVRTYILDELLEPVPVGVAGELHIGGVQVARGYFNRPELTAERFVASPFVAGDRLYKTGDVARSLSDGTIEYLGRNDFQVKIRGFRIELGEIESRLSEHELVGEVAVVAREDVSGEKRLVAYYVVAGDAVAIDAEQLRLHLQSTLPEYMVPAAYVALDSLPLTANGKVDRKGLPAPDDTAYSRTEYEAPQGDVEQTLARIWSEALGVERIGRHDNFFALGGHSLLIVRVIDRMRAAGLHADVRTLFTASTLMELAGAVLREVSTVVAPPNGIVAGSEAILPEMLPLVSLDSERIKSIVARVPDGARNIQDIYPLAPLQEGLLFHHLLATEGDPYVVYSVFRFDSRERMEKYLSAFQRVIDRHDVLRTSVVWEGLPEAVQVVWRKAPLLAEEVLLDPADGNIVQRLAARFDPRRYRLDLGRAPMMHVAYAQEHAGGSYVLVRLAHQIMLDHEAQKVVQHEIAAYLHGEEGQLPEPVPFRTVVAQARLGVSREEHEAFFRSMLGDVSQATLPFGLADVQGDGSGVVAAYHPIESSLSRRLRSCARHLGVSAASVCHVAWARVLSVLSGRDDVVFGTVVFGRMQGGESAGRIVGLPLNMLPLRVKMTTSVEVGVRETHAALAQLMYHEHAPLALAQRCSGVAAPAPLFSALLNYRHNSAKAINRAQDGIEVLGGRERTNYPLMLAIDDFGGNELSLQVQVHRSLDARRTCGYMNRALVELVEALERAPESSLNELRVLPEIERHQLLVEWNATEHPYRSDACVHELFEEQVARTPDAVALVYEDVQVSYGELNARANRLAHYLRRVGVGPESRVAVCLERSVEMVVSLLAVLKAGGAYVPLDPTYPLDRLAYMLEDSAPSVTLTHGMVATNVRAVLDRGAAPVLVVDQSELWSDGSPANPARGGVSPANLAYMIYAPGSTGQFEGSIGRASGNTRMYIVDERLEPVPIGVAGEVYVGGAGVARGYWNRPELTAERFVLSPFISGDRLYKTGDVGRYLADGTIEILGRNDLQVTIRGFRTDLGEIESALRTYAGVHDAVVAAREDSAGEMRLVAYYVVAEDAVAIDAEQLRLHLQSVLPEQMVPAAYVRLESLPLTASGKVDRKGLPTPDDMAYGSRVYEAPQGEVEQTLARIWSEALAVERVGRHDNFFALGGHSLLVVRITNLLKRSGLDVTVTELFKFATISSLAEYLHIRTLTRSFKSLVIARETGRRRPLFLMHELLGGDAYFPVLAQHIDNEVPIYGLSGIPLHEPQLNDMKALAARVITIIRHVQQTGPYRIAGWSFGGILAYETAQQLISAGESIEFLGLIDSQCPPRRSAYVQYSAKDVLVGWFLEKPGINVQQIQSIKAISDQAHRFDFEAITEQLLEVCDFPDSLMFYDLSNLERSCERQAAHHQAIANYEPYPISTRVHIFAARDQVLQTGETEFDESLRWAALLPPASLRVVSVPGTHFSIMDKYVQDLGCKISIELKRIDISQCLPEEAVRELGAV